MGIRKEDLYHLIDQLQENDQQKAYDFLEHLINNPSTDDLRAYWDAVETHMEADEEPLSDEERRQLKNQDFISWDQLKQECGQA